MSDITPKPGPGTSNLRAIARLTWRVNDVEKVYPVTAEGITIGRSSENNLAVQDLAASRFHCKLLPEDGGLVVVDLGSTNGTFLNASRVSESHSVRDGDELRIGDITFRVEIFLPEPEVSEPGVEMEAIPLEETFIMPAEEDFPWLMVSSGVGKGTVYPLTREKMQVGRASRNQQWDIDLVDKSVSRPHAELTHLGDKWVLTDLGSANGTRVNSKDIHEPRELSEGDVVEFGESLLIFRITKGA